MRCPSDSATEHLRRCIPCGGLLSAGYSDQFGVNQEVVVASLIASGTKRRDVELVASKHLLNVSANKGACGMAIGSATTGSHFTRFLLPILQPR